MSKVKTNLSQNVNKTSVEIHPDIENKFKIVLKIMSWIVGVCFILLIFLPLFDFYLIDIIVKSLYFIGLFNLILFAVLEFFAQKIKVFLSKNKV
jgi:hypothetical protein